jgi:hypothetical protein
MNHAVHRKKDDESWSYRFTCPRCRRLSVSTTDEGAGTAAITAGCAFEEWRLPTRRGKRPGGPPFTNDDVVALRNRFLDPSWFDALLQRDNDLR